MKYRGIIICLACMLLLGGCGKKTVEITEEPKVNEQVEVSEPVKITQTVEDTEQVKVTEPVEDSKQAEVTEPLREISYAELTEEQLALFVETGKVGVEDFRDHLIPKGMLEDMQNDKIISYIGDNNLPSNGLELFAEWKERTNYYSQFEDSLNGRDESNAGINKDDEQQTSKPSETSSSKTPSDDNQTPDPDEYTPTIPTNKPKKTPEQIQQQIPNNNDDSGIPLTPEENREAFEGMTDGSNGGGGVDMSTHGYEGHW